ncbi:hypothetical protein BJY01DRAFT_247102 [Aspergillus pseudoustus]|uniref:ARCA protein n=1 Tax=Aspergillus pseudoustus TaxID=1810923 RepID=A0ABR4K6L4_9EURO
MNGASRQTPIFPSRENYVDSANTSESPSASLALNLGSTTQSNLPVHYDAPGQVFSPADCGGQSRARLAAILLRYFVEEISHWFDICDPDRHFARVVPQRARACPPLLHAILTASSRHITRLPGFRNRDGDFGWKDMVIPGLDEDTALHYHNHCIKELLNLSGDLEQINNENLLAAAIVLRFYEEIDSPLENHDDKGVLLRVLNIFVNAQLPSAAAFPRSLLEIHYSGLSPLPESDHNRPFPTQNNYTEASGLRRSCFWVAFRQELYKSFMTQQPFTLPLSRWESFRALSPAGTGTWTDRLVLFCADVLEYCYGSSETNLIPSTDKGRWWDLVQYVEALADNLPPCFEPIYTLEPSSTTGEIFPEVWFSDGSYATGTAHLELAKMLLAVFDPTRPKLGHGHMAAMRALTATMRSTVTRLCGIALHNRRSPPVFVDATMAISACGEYFTDEDEREALLGVLRLTEVEYAWPTGNIAEKLKRAWMA